MNSELPDSWKWRRLDEVAEVILGQSPPGSSYNTAGEGVPFFQGKAEFGPIRPTVAKWTTEPKKLAEEDDVLLSVRAPVGPTNLAPYHCSIGRGLAALRGRDVLPMYLLHWMRASADDLASTSTGTTFDAVTGRQVKSYPIPVPPLDEQRQIVEAIETHLSHLDAGVESLKRAKRSARLMWVASLRKLLGKASAGAATVRLDEVAEVRLGRQRSPKNHEGPHMRPYIRAANVTWDGLDLSDVKSMNWDPERSAKYRMEPGDLVLAEGSGSDDEVGKPAIWDGEIEECYFQNTLIRVRPHEDLTSRFLKHFFTHEAVAGSFARASRGVNIHHLGSKTLAAWPTPVPSRNAQDEFVADVEQVLSGVEGAQRDVNTAERRADGLRRSILSAAFRGRLTA